MNLLSPVSYHCYIFRTKDNSLLSRCWFESLGCPKEELIENLREREFRSIKRCHQFRGLMACKEVYSLEEDGPEPTLQLLRRILKNE